MKPDPDKIDGPEETKTISWESTFLYNQMKLLHDEMKHQNFNSNLVPCKKAKKKISFTTTIEL